VNNGIKMIKIENLLGERLIRQIPQFNKRTKYHKATLYIAKCPEKNCLNEVRIYKRAQLNQRCRACSVKLIDHANKKPQNWVFLTDNIDNARSPVAKVRPDLFIREEIVKRSNNTHGAIRTILKCPTENCENTFITKDSIIRTCKKCSNIIKKKRPYERTYNRSKKVAARDKTNGVKIEWLLSYEEFATLCEIANCHYCDELLNRAKYRAEVGSTSLLLDRKDSNLSYTFENCVPCCPRCNDTKGQYLSYEEMVAICEMRGVWIPK
jgi:ribosomal protein S27E